MNAAHGATWPWRRKPEAINGFGEFFVCINTSLAMSKIEDVPGSAFPCPAARRVLSIWAIPSSAGRTAIMTDHLSMEKAFEG